MSTRWLILGVLAIARIAMGFQFQAVASVALAALRICQRQGPPAHPAAAVSRL